MELNPPKTASPCFTVWQRGNVSHAPTHPPPTRLTASSSKSPRGETINVEFQAAAALGPAALLADEQFSARRRTSIGSQQPHRYCFSRPNACVLAQYRSGSRWQYHSRNQATANPSPAMLKRLPQCGSYPAKPGPTHQREANNQLTPIGRELATSPGGNIGAPYGG